MTTTAPRPLPTGDELTRFQIDLLVALEDLGTTKGIRLRSALNERYTGEVNHGRLYPNLDELDDDGLIEKTDGEDKRSNCYALTKRGAAVLDERRDWLTGGSR